LRLRQRDIHKGSERRRSARPRSVLLWLCSASLVAAAVFWPNQIQHATPALVEFRVPIELASRSTEDYLANLESRGLSLEDQGIRVETLEGDFILASHQEDQTFNPASVMKIATSLAALERFGPDHRFETAFYIDGAVSDGVLDGDLVLASDGDPDMNTSELVSMVRQVRRAGVRRVDGRFVVSGPFTVGNLHRQQQVASYLVRTLRRVGVRVPEEVTYGPVAGIEVVRRRSDPLREILFYQNSHSVNKTADRLGEALGGPQAIQEFMIGKVGIPKDEIRVARASGLRRNRITPRGTVLMLRRLVRWLGENGMDPEEILPVAGVDSGTLRLRLNDRRTRGAVVAKTGTLVSTDGGVAALAGILYTQDYGPVLFTILNARGPVIQHRRFQDRFVRDLLAEYGGRGDFNPLLRRRGT
jgi:D-alanyl-D-alanine carboxypeptidase/D-alanyl-D-alanine-endopeptidase (penicillin-binding protein 4)